MNKEETNDFLLKNNGDCVNLHCYDCYYYSDTYSKPLSTRCKIYEHHNVEPLSAPDFFHINDKLKMQIILKSRYKQMAEILK